LVEIIVKEFIVIFCLYGMKKKEYMQEYMQRANLQYTVAHTIFTNTIMFFYIKSHYSAKMSLVLIQHRSLNLC